MELLLPVMVRPFCKISRLNNRHVRCLHRLLASLPSSCFQVLRGHERTLLDIAQSTSYTVDEDDIKLLGNHQLEILAEPIMLTFRDLQIDSQTVTR